jgi:hypothetical protein
VHISDYYVMRDAMFEMHDLRISVLCVGASLLSFSRSGMTGNHPLY